MVSEIKVGLLKLEIHAQADGRLVVFIRKECEASQRKREVRQQKLKETDKYAEIWCAQSDKWANIHSEESERRENFIRV